MRTLEMLPKSYVYLEDNHPRIAILALKRGLTHDNLLYKKLVKNQISNVKDALA